MKWQKRVGLVAVILVTVLACAPLLPSVAPLPTRPAGAVSTMVAGTRNVAITQTARFLPPPVTPTITRTPSKTPTITPPPTATFLFLFPTSNPVGTAATSTKGGGSRGGGIKGGGDDEGDTQSYRCSVLGVNPPNGSVFSPGQVIGTITWHVKNTGHMSWNPRFDRPNIDYVLLSGPLLDTYVRYDTHPLVPPGGEISLQIGITGNDSRPPRPAIAPSPSEPREKPYTVNWGMTVEGYDMFCQDLKFTFYVR